MCRYFSTFCKFGDNCCYKHVTSESNTVTDTIHLEALSKIEHLEATIKVMSERVMALEEKLQNIDI